MGTLSLTFDDMEDNLEQLFKIFEMVEEVACACVCDLRMDPSFVVRIWKRWLINGVSHTYVISASVVHGPFEPIPTLVRRRTRFQIQVRTYMFQCGVFGVILGLQGRDIINVVASTHEQYACTSLLKMMPEALRE